MGFNKILLLVFCHFFIAGSVYANSLKSQLSNSWVQIINDEFNKKYFLELENYLANERINKTILPPEDQVFTAFNLVPFEDVKVVLIGQDPYQTLDKKTGLAYGHGLAFSIAPEITTIPPSLKNIFKKISKEYNTPIAKYGNLTSWANQGVLLMNAILTVEKDKAGSHRNKPSKNANWELFTDVLIEKIAQSKKNVVFLLWGEFAKSKRALINKYSVNQHLIIESQHPSPLATGKPSFIDGPDIFKPVNLFLKSKNKKTIDWTAN